MLAFSYRKGEHWR